MDDNKEQLLEDSLEELIEETGVWTQDEALYVVVPEIEYECSKCSFYSNQSQSYQLVSGDIDPQGHCRFWVDKNELQEESLSLSESIRFLEEDKEFSDIISPLLNEEINDYTFETYLENLVSDLYQETQELSNSKAVSLVKEDKNPEGGLTEKGRAKFNKSTGSNLKPGVKGAANTPDKMRRKGSFLRRFYAKSPIPPLKKPNGEPTRFALAAAAWGEPVPSSTSAVRRLAAKGEALLKRYQNTKEKSKQKLSQTIEELPICLSNGFLKIPVAKKGKWYHEKFGIISFDDKDFEEMQRLSSKEVLGFTPYVTYGHPTDLPYESVDAELKKGNLVGWEQSEDSIFALFDAKDDAIELVRKGDYEYSSGEFIRNYKDKFSGKNMGTVLTRIALTNSPFIPFGDTKVEVLSINASEQDSPLNKISFMIKLSTEAIKEHPNNNSNILSDIHTMDQLNTNVSNEVKIEAPLETKPEVTQEPSTTVVLETSGNTNSVQPQIQTPSAFDLNKLVETITHQVNKVSEATLSKVTATYEATIQKLNEQVDSLRNQLVQQQQVTQAFSTTLSQQAKAQNYQRMAKEGVSPALIQQFSTVESALEANQTVVKLSNSAGQIEDKPVLELIQQLLVSAVNSEPVVYQQFGQTSSVNNNTNAVDASIRELIEQNKQAANKKSI